ncbi:hypothetical protein Dimus_035381 [Dionaea muscipula]
MRGCGAEVKPRPQEKEGSVDGEERRDSSTRVVNRQVGVCPHLFQHDPPAGISGAPQDNNIMLWNAVIFGPDDTPWDGGNVEVEIRFYLILSETIFGPFVIGDFLFISSFVLVDVL